MGYATIIVVFELMVVDASRILVPEAEWSVNCTDTRRGELSAQRASLALEVFLGPPHAELTIA